MKQVLVTGGAGFIGSHFIKYLLNKYKDYKIINLDCLTYAGNLNNLKKIEDNKNYRFIKGNICDKKLVSEIIKDCQYVVNFAAETHVDNSINSPEIFIKTNVEGTLNLLECSRKSNIEKYLQISTDEVYCSLGETGYFKETTPLNPNSPYSASKASADMLTRAYYKTYNLPAIITRCSNNYGPNQYPEKLIPFFISKILKGEKVPLYSKGENIRDWLYVEEHCRAIDLVLQKGKIGEVYNIGGNCEKSNIEITKILLNKLNKTTDFIEYVKDRPGHDMRYAMDTSKIQKELGWKNETDFEKGIEKTINWYLENKDDLIK